MTRTTAVLMALGLCGILAPPASADQDEEAIKAVIIGAAQAASEFSRTRDPQSVLKAYAADYVGIQDGDRETRATIEQWLSEYGAELDKGNPTRFLGEVFGLQVRIVGPIAWATYDYRFTLVADGESRAEDRGLCTSLLEQHGERWLIHHEHCSKTKPTER